MVTTEGFWEGQNRREKTTCKYSQQKSIMYLGICYIHYINIYIHIYNTNAGYIYVCNCKHIYKYMYDYKVDMSLVIPAEMSAMDAEGLKGRLHL